MSMSGNVYEDSEKPKRKKENGIEVQNFNAIRNRQLGNKKTCYHNEGTNLGPGGPMTMLQIQNCRYSITGMPLNLSHVKVKSEETQGNKKEITNGIPYLQLYWFVLDCDHSGPKFNPNGQIVDWLETLVRKLQKKT